IPSFDFVQDLPPSSLRHTPPRKFPTPFRLHIFGRGKSCVQLFTLQARPLTSGSNTIQYVVFIHSFGTPLVELIQDCAPSSLRKRPMRSEEHTSELQSRFDIVCRLLLEK